ncbi:alpha/beta hydrolase [Mycobacterium nebraskense]|uniref:DUF1023 domain-containing protein n=1 Tax=Mycobacterium nebraskense TaxID=244292 RepID=A0A1X1ZQE7_9MYCO|nr:alpha/beta hydrolase [Mycobacterium nebraskense]KKC04807.1 hypothetical protein WU83_11725 [Mycobacterium nebraskense]MBI2696904.1 hypothetical protein [Mycobacterium nebraskense]MCV7117016.1 hypothetical protein [Mycobacterium nebraskense]ORW25535.1 hypothetical protein AWC17_01800 [Mycobacterium nebraskense]
MARERYDRPKNLFEAASPDRARAGAEALDSFQSGMGASHVGAPSIDTVIGHSYGSTMVGAAATGGHYIDAPDGYILQIIARYKPGYPPSLQGISPCFPPELPDNRSPFPAILTA